ncbi:acyl-CoA dehydrogenase family protein [Cupriavidus gilardii]|uniref:Acyl-CoA dehydrogenase n=1 Tax=Cupriavidus gilardii TaxID=82541 RepID=A0A849B4K3_9BURK|nr:acyl-CoA dehydrogenase family protein [Cupriavidus gilardii]QQE07912.1 acyl-CoA dehydrogenase family protein [Cupriavidus sp. ISTL7]KAB0595944.1 acyl-CoA dehydrogenase [Cupriavidus gilardii]MCT9016341.1 acyl-CoA dehydrogenase family protein [Cupriavidus gilardii]MCT9056111.1 acyl-CoA dehydrogenase family protein [Cupriavidus gilardii]MCT9118304.1 acyl-CoA dehydrogenase family protein [Cupriavidus gilardii]
MNFELSEEHQAFAESVRRFAQDKLAPGALQRAHSAQYPWDAARMLAEQGLLGIAFPEEDGGQGGTLMHAVIAIQEIALVCPKSADIVQAGNFGPIRTFVEYATPEQKARFLPDLLAGRKLIALGMTEPEAGSAVTELRTTARRDGDHYVIDGSKIFSTHSPEAELFLIYVRFGPGINGIGSVLVERGAPGFQIGEPSKFMSGEEWCQLYFEDCRIPAGNLLLGEGGFKRQIAGFNVERLGNSSRALALGRHCFNVAREHAMVRKQFGRELCEFQGIQWKFAEMALKLESAQLLLYRAAMEGEHGLPSAHSTAMAKLACNQAGWDVANEALQIMGGMGYSQESIVEYCLRRIRGWMIAGGSIEMLKNRIAEGVFGRSFPQRPPRPAPN